MHGYRDTFYYKKDTVTPLCEYNHICYSVLAVLALIQFHLLKLRVRDRGPPRGRGRVPRTGGAAEPPGAGPRAGLPAVDASGYPPREEKRG